MDKFHSRTGSDRMYCKFKYLDNSGWTVFGQVVAPLNFGETIQAEVTTAYAITLYFNGATEITKESLTPGTICQIDFNTKKYYYVIVDGGKIEPKTGYTYCHHSYTVQELLAYTREIYTQLAFYSEGAYTVAEFLTRLLALSEKDKTIVIDQTGDYQTLLDNWLGADYQTASNSLLDNLIKVGLNNQVRFKARINSSNEIELYLKNLKGGSIISTIDGTLLSENKKYLGANYASRVIGQVNNITSNDFSWIPNLNIGYGKTVEPESDESAEITADTAVLKLPFKIKKANTVRVLGMGSVITDSNTQMTGYVGSDYRVFTADGTRIYPDTGKYVDIDKTLQAPQLAYRSYDLVSYKEWQLLDPNASGGAANHQENTLYYKVNDTKIYNMKICDGEFTDNFNQPSYYVEVWSGGAKVSTTNIYPELVWESNKHIIFVSFYDEAVIEINNKNTSKRTAFYSQEENLVSGDALVSNMNTYIESMQNEEETVTYEFSSIDDLPEVGSIFNGKVIAAIVCNGFYNRIEATITLSDELVKKSEYISADDGLDLPDINVEKAFNRFTTYKTKMWFCKTNSEAAAAKAAYGVDTYYNLDDYYSILLNGIENDRETAAIEMVEINLKTGDNPYIYTAAAVSVRVIKNVLMATFKTINNLTIGYLRDNTLGDDPEDLRFYPVAFIETDGQCQNMHFKMRTIITSAANYPAIDQTKFDRTTGVIVDIPDSDFYHDPAEVLNLSYQIEAKPYNSKGYVNREYFEQCRILNDTYSNPDPYIRGAKFYNAAGELEISSLMPSAPTYTYVSAGIYSVEIPVTTSLAAGTAGTLIIERMDDGTYQNPVKMLKTEAIISGTTQKYIKYYVAFTK